MALASIILAIAGSLLSAGGTVPYILETARGKTKPRIVTWLTWSLLAGVASAASFSAGELASGLFGALGFLATGAVAAFGFRYGDRGYELIDIICQVAVIVGLVLWLLFNSPVIAIVAVITIDFVGLVPTLRHAWRKPHEETASTFLIVGLGGWLAVFAAAIANGMSLMSIGYPLYVALSMGFCGLLILSRKPAVAKV